MAEMEIDLVEAVRRLRLAEPTVGVKSIVKQLRPTHGDAADTRAVRIALQTLETLPGAPTAAADIAADAIAADATARVGADSERLGSAESVRCWGCEAKPEAGTAFKQCERCVDEGLFPARFCSSECLQQHWPRHKQWHKEQKIRAKVRASRMAVIAPSYEKVASDAEAEGTPIGTTYATGMREMADAQYKQAAKSFRKVIDLDPSNGSAWHSLGQSLSRSGESSLAAQAYLRASELYKTGSPAWAEAVTDTFAAFTKCVHADVPRPSWWTDEGIMAISEEAIHSVSWREITDDRGMREDEDGRAQVKLLMMRSHVLSGPILLPAEQLKWEFGSRTNHDMREAAWCFGRLIKLLELTNAHGRHHPDHAGAIKYNRWQEARCRELAEGSERL